MIAGRGVIALVVGLAAAAAIAWRVYALAVISGGGSQAVGIVYVPDESPKRPYVRAAYEEVLTEEGIPHQWISISDILLVDGRRLARRFPVLVFPDGIAQAVPAQTLDRMREYVDGGGRLAIVFDPGIKEPGGAYRPGGVLASLAGVEYQRYQAIGGRAYIQGSLHFTDVEAARRWGFPDGKLIHNDVLAGYAYGKLGYPVANAVKISRDLVTYAAFQGIPVLTERSAGAGRVLWVDLPLGYLKAYSDDLPLRQVLRVFVLDEGAMPHLVPSPGGVGGIVIDWHVDSRVEMQGLPNLEAAGILRPGVRMEFDITAGPDRDAPGDGLGFDACGRGRAWVAKLARYGEIGSHGGWAHNWFAVRLETSRLPEADIERDIQMNNACLQRITGRPVVAYAAPEGVFPQPVSSRVLERLGMAGYYYTGDSGAPPNRTFFDGAMASTSVWAFPIMPNGRTASLGEMALAHDPPAEVSAWLRGTLDYAIAQHAVRLVYSHPYDLLHSPYVRAYSGFLDDVERSQRAGLVRAETMAEVASFERRFILTTFSAQRDGARVRVRLANPSGLRDICFALPDSWLAPGAPPPGGVVSCGATSGYRLFAAASGATEFAADFEAAGR